jgi:hypothetical protein
MRQRETIRRLAPPRQRFALTIYMPPPRLHATARFYFFLRVSAPRRFIERHVPPMVLSTRMDQPSDTSKKETHATSLRLGGTSGHPCPGPDVSRDATGRNIGHARDASTRLADLLGWIHVRGSLKPAVRPDGPVTPSCWFIEPIPLFRA